MTKINHRKKRPETPKPTSQRVKVTLACTVCRKKKVKCNGAQPTCSRCHSMKIPCQYSDPPRKRGPPKGKVEVIESRAHRIESLFQKPLQNWQNTLDPQVCSSPNPLLSLIGNTVDCLETQTKDITRKTAGSHGIHLHQTISKTNNSTQWAQDYFSHFNLFFPILSRPHFMHQLTHSPHSLDPLLKKAVDVFGLYYAEPQNFQSSLDAFEECKLLLNVKRDSLSTIQGLLLMCWYAYLTGHHQTSTNLRRQLMSLVKELELYHDPDPCVGLLESEMLRRAFWVAFVTDQWMAGNTGQQRWLRPHLDVWDCQWPQFEDEQLFGLTNEEIAYSANQNLNHNHNHNHNHLSPQIQFQKHQHQHQQSQFNTPNAIQVTCFAEMIRLCLILGMNEGRHGSTASVCQQSHDRLVNWYLNLPSYLNYNQPQHSALSFASARFYRMAYYAAQIIVHNRPFESIPQQSSSSCSVENAGMVESTKMSKTICTNAATTLIEMADQMLHSNNRRHVLTCYMPFLTLAGSIRLDLSLDSMCYSNEIEQTINVLKAVNPTPLSLVSSHGVLNNFFMATSPFVASSAQHQQEYTHHHEQQHNIEHQSDYQGYPQPQPHQQQQQQQQQQQHNHHQNQNNLGCFPPPDPTFMPTPSLQAVDINSLLNDSFTDLFHPCHQDLLLKDPVDISPWLHSGQFDCSSISSSSSSSDSQSPLVSSFGFPHTLSSPAPSLSPLQSPTPFSLHSSMFGFSALDLSVFVPN